MHQLQSGVGERRAAFHLRLGQLHAASIIQAQVGSSLISIEAQVG